jgi:hypothetical protein
VGVSPARSSGSRPSEEAILGAVLDDLRSTLRVGWVDPALRNLAADPIFLAAAWAATRPNVTRSFAAGADKLQKRAVDAARRLVQPAVLTDWIRDEFANLERERLARTAQALHHAAARTYLVVQAWAMLARRQTIPGTGREESPAKRGIPSWQEGLVGTPRALSEEAEALVDDMTVVLGLSATPSALRLAGRWPRYLELLVGNLRSASETPGWNSAVIGLRRGVAEVLRELPHPMSLQWDVLERRGLTDERRTMVADHLTTATSAMPANVLIAAAIWVSVGEPEIPAEF